MHYLVLKGLLPSSYFLFQLCSVAIGQHFTITCKKCVHAYRMHHTLITNEKLSGTASLPTMKRLPLSSSLQKHKSEKHTDSARSSVQLEREG